MRRGIIRDRASYYLINTQIDIISACCLLHNHIRREMRNDPIEPTYDENPGFANVQGDRIQIVETSNEWSTWRDNLAIEIYKSWRARQS
jgi:hypothetical protein